MAIRYFMSEIEKLQEQFIEQAGEIKNISKMVCEIRFAIIGNDEAGINGISQIVQFHTKYINEDKKLKNRIAGALIVISTVGSALFSWLWKKLEL